VVLIKLDHSSAEFRKCSSSSKVQRIKDIYRVQNPCQFSKSEFVNKLKDLHLNIANMEQKLFHGSRYECRTLISEQGFDWKLNGLHGAAYGQGTYFALNSSYSVSYSQPDQSNRKMMFFASVLVGRFTNGNSTMRRPPQDDQ
jgi:hypothetical protein